VLPDFADFHVSSNHDKSQFSRFPGKTVKSINVNVADFDISVC